LTGERNAISGQHSSVLVFVTAASANLPLLVGCAWNRLIFWGAWSVDNGPFRC